MIRWQKWLSWRFPCTFCYLIISFYVLHTHTQTHYNQFTYSIHFIYLRKKSISLSMQCMVFFSSRFVSYGVSNLGRVLCQPCETTLCAMCFFPLLLLFLFLFLFTCEWNIIFDAWYVWWLVSGVCVCVYMSFYDDRNGNTIKSNLWINRTWFENGKINLYSRFWGVWACACACVCVCVSAPVSIYLRWSNKSHRISSPTLAEINTHTHTHASTNATPFVLLQTWQIHCYTLHIHLFSYFFY